eukprot:6514380-Prymnesium_polylepis.1
MTTRLEHDCLSVLCELARGSTAGAEEHPARFGRRVERQGGLGAHRQAGASHFLLSRSKLDMQ